MTQWLIGIFVRFSTSKDDLINCAEVGRRNRILTNYRFLSHSLFSDVTDDGRSSLTEIVRCGKIIDDLNFKGTKERPCLILIIF